MKSRHCLAISLLLAVGAGGYLAGYHQGWRVEKKRSTEFNIRRSLHVLREAERGETDKIAKGCRMYLMGHTRTYENLVSASDIPESFRSTYSEARQIASEVKSNLVVVDAMMLP